MSQCGSRQPQDLARQAFLKDTGPGDGPSGAGPSGGGPSQSQPSASRLVTLEPYTELDDDGVLLPESAVSAAVARDGASARDGSATSATRMPGNDRPLAVCAIGAFDGVHSAHRFLIRQVVEEARSRAVQSVLVTFDPDPDEIFRPLAQQRKIMDNQDRIDYLLHFGADVVLVVPFTAELAALTAQEFIDKVISPVCTPVSLHVGADFRLGVGNEGSVESLRILGESRGFAVHGHELVENAGEPVSATRIRNLIQDGKVEEASSLLCRPHFVRGTVVSGRQKGTGFGFPTANIVVSYPYVLPAKAVYAGFVLADGVAYPAAMNVGAPQTFDPDNPVPMVEAHLTGYDGNLYGCAVSVCFTHYLRPQRHFDSVQELISTVMGNIDWVAQHLGTQGLPL